MRSVENDQLMPVLRELIEQGRAVNLTISGSSMSPFLIHHRDSVIIEKPKESLRPGNIVFYQRPSGAYVLHRIHHLDAEGNLFLIGDAQNVMEGPLDSGCVFGIVTKVRRKDRWIAPGDFWWEFFEHVWLHVIPLRRSFIKCFGFIKIK
jgi:signal peptidase